MSNNKVVKINSKPKMKFRTMTNKGYDGEYKGHMLKHGVKYISLKTPEMQAEFHILRAVYGFDAGYVANFLEKTPKIYFLTIPHYATAYIDELKSNIIDMGCSEDSTENESETSTANNKIINIIDL